MARLTNAEAETVGRLIGIPFGLAVWTAKVTVACLIAKTILLT